MTNRLPDRHVRATIVAVVLLSASGLIARPAYAQQGAPGEIGGAAMEPYVDAESYYYGHGHGPGPMGPWQWQVLPDGLIYRSYMAGAHESRISGTVFHEKDMGWQLNVALGGRVGILRLGTTDDAHPEGWQLDVEGAAFPRINLDANWDMDAADFRFGVPLTYGVGNVQTKFGYYHLSSHLGDEFAIRNPGSLASRINFSRDTLIAGVSYYPCPAMRLYTEAGWAFHRDGGSDPWEFQFGTDYSQPGETGSCGTPFIAINGHLRQEVDFGGNVVVQVGWLWRGASGHTLRTGLHYYNGKSNQFQFFDESEEQIGMGLWYDY